MQQSEKLEILIVAGEASGDHHGALLVEQLRSLLPDAHLFGMGGTQMRAAGVETIVDSETAASVMGLTEVARGIGSLLGAFRTLRSEAVRRKPACVIFIDFPDFNMLLMRALRKHVASSVYYITPQVWAWRSYRAEILARYTDLLLPIFPFEAEFFAGRGLEAEYVGHPFATRKVPDESREEFCSELGLNPGRTILAMLPGSRRAEIERLAELFTDAVRNLLEEDPEVQVVLPLANGLDAGWVSQQFRRCEPKVAEIEAWRLLNVADLGLIASGTATMEAALAGCPFVVAYRVSPLTYAVGKQIIRGVENIAMPNLIAGRRVVPELLQEQASRERLGFELRRILRDEQHRNRMVAGLQEVAEKLQFADGMNSSERAARRIAALLAGTTEAANVCDAPRASASA